MHKKDFLIISHLRKDARMSMTQISKQTKIPVSTIFDKLREYDKQIIEKHSCILNFKALGYDIKAHTLYKVTKDDRETFIAFLRQHPSTNNIFRTNNGYDLLVESIFRDLQDLETFHEQTNQYQLEAKQEYFILEDLARERFMTHEQGFAITHSELLR